MISLDTLSSRVLAAAKKAGAEAADVLVLRGTAISVDVRGGALEMAERAEGVDIGLRVLIGQKQACVSVSNDSDATLTQMAERAVAMAGEAPDDPYAGLAEPHQLAQDLDCSALELYDPTPEPSSESLQADAMAAEVAAMAVAQVTQCQSASASYSARDIHIAASNGFSAGFRRTTRHISCVAIAGSGLGMERDHDADSRTFQSDLRSASEIGRKAGERAAERLSPRKPPTGAFPVLFDERVAGSLIGHLLGAVYGPSVARGASWLRDKLGAQILPKSLSLIEDPHRKRMAASRLFDSEGLATAPRKIVDAGVLTGWTLDLATARQLGMVSTRNAARGLSSPPSPSNWNIELTQGSQSRQDLIRDMGTGLLVTSLIGSTINPNTGDYSRGAAGLWIENGEIAYPVNECTIAGNLLDMLVGLVPANDAETWQSRVVPSLLVPGMTLAGA